MIRALILFSISLLFVVSVSPAFAQHHSGALSPPIDFDGLKLALITLLTPEDYTSDDSEKANLSVRLFNSETNANVKSVTYRIQIFHQDNLVANEYFFDEDGKLDIEIKPKTECLNQELWKCTKYFGEKHPIAGAYYARGDSIPVIQGPVFDKSGQYNVKVSIVGATNPKTMTTKDLLFETFVHVPEKETFLVKTANAQEFPVSIKSYGSKVSNFNHDENLGKISFNLITNTEESSHHGSSIEQSIILHKDFLSFKQGYGVDVFVDGKQLDNEFVQFDTEFLDKNIIKIEIPNGQLFDKQNENSLGIEIFSGNLIEYNSLDVQFKNNIFAQVSWDSKSETGKKIPFTFSFSDENNNPLKAILFAYSISDSSGKEIWSNLGAGDSHIGIVAMNGISKEQILIPEPGHYTLKLILTGQNSQNFDEFLISQSDFEILGIGDLETKPTVIPSWIKTNAGWWSDGIIGDQEFVQSIQFLIKEKIVNIPPTESGSSQTHDIPDWVKKNAGWWSDGLVGDSDFVLGIQFLISSGILKV